MAVGPRAAAYGMVGRMPLFFFCCFQIQFAISMLWTVVCHVRWHERKAKAAEAARVIHAAADEAAVSPWVCYKDNSEEAGGRGCELHMLVKPSTRRLR